MKSTAKYGFEAHRGGVRIESWLYRRTEFHHDWLNNRFRPFLHARRTWLEAAEASGACPEEGLLAQLREWTERVEEGRALLEDALTGLSAVQLFEQWPLCEVPDWAQSWLVEISDVGNQRGGEVQTLVETAKGALRRADHDHRALLQHLTRGGKGKTEKERTRTAQLISSLGDLSRAISELPHEICIATSCPVSF